jgi:copper chaperone CopZ
MQCDGCVKAVREALAKVSGVQSHQVHLDEADVTFDDSTCRTAQIVGAIRAAGFDVAKFELVAE